MVVLNERSENIPKDLREVATELIVVAEKLETGPIRQAIAHGSVLVVLGAKVSSLGQQVKEAAR